MEIRVPAMADRVQAFRAFCPEATRGKTDTELEQALRGADKWIGWKKYSAMIVAQNYLVDGHYHS